MSNVYHCWGGKSGNELSVAEGKFNGKTINISCVGCWPCSGGYTRIRQIIRKSLVVPMNKSGYGKKIIILDVAFTISKGELGVFDVYQEIEDKKIMIFSNNEANESTGALIDETLSENNYKDVIAKLILG